MGATSPLALTLGALGSAPITAVVIVVGHARDRIAAFFRERTLPYPVRQIFNPRWDTANNIYSAKLARESCAAGFLLVNSDVICHPRIFRSALAAPDESFLLVDPTTPPRAEAMKVQYRDGRLTRIAKDIAPERAHGEYIGIARFDAAGARCFFEKIEQILDRGGSTEWYEAAIHEAAREVRFSRRSTYGFPWIEIDDPADLDRAEREVLPALSGEVSF